jgi:hypothetical protein
MIPVLITILVVFPVNSASNGYLQVKFTIQLLILNPRR